MRTELIWASGACRPPWVITSVTSTATWTRTDELVGWEAKYDLHIAPKFPFLALCQYYLGAFGGEVVLDALKTHPLCIVGQLVHENPFYTSPEKFLDELGIRSGRETLGKETTS